MSHLGDEQLSMLVDGELSLGAREAVGRHLRECAACTRRLDDLVEVAAELRLAPAVVWDAAATDRVLAVLEERTAREWSTPIAAALACVGVVLLLFELPAIAAAASLLSELGAVVSAFLPTGFGLPSSTLVVLLVVVAVLCPLLAVPLVRQR